MTYKHHHIFLLFLFLLTACGDHDKKDVASTVPLNDSLNKVLNSPELKALNAELLKDPSSSELYHKRAFAYLKLGQLNEAVGDELRANRIDSTKSEYYLQLADVYFAQNKTKLAKETLEIIEQRFPQNTEAKLKLGELYFLVQDYQKAIDHVNKALKVNENLAQAYFLKANIYRESGDTSKAVSNYITTTEQDPKFAMAFQDLGVIYAAKKDPIAFEYYKNALKLDPSNLDVKYGVAKLLQDLGKTEEAIREYNAILEKDKSFANCYYNLGAIHFELKKDNKKALEYFSKAIEAKPDYIEAYFARGLTYQRLKDKVSAKADYEMCIRLQANYEPAIRGLNEL